MGKNLIVFDTRMVIKEAITHAFEQSPLAKEALQATNKIGHDLYAPLLHAQQRIGAEAGAILYDSGIDKAFQHLGFQGPMNPNHPKEGNGVTDWWNSLIPAQRAGIEVLGVLAALGTITYLVYRRRATPADISQQAPPGKNTRVSTTPFWPDGRPPSSQ